MKTLFKYYIKASLRSMAGKPMVTFIVLLGLVLGFASSLIISLWVQNQLSFDKFHKNYHQIYQVVLNSSKQSDVFGTHIPTTFAPAFKDQIAQVKNSCLFYKVGQGVFKYQDKKFNEKGGYYADAGTFDVFTFPFKFGNPAKALKQKNQIVLTEKLAHKYFGNQNPVGKKIMHDRFNLTVVGVVKTLPVNSQIQFDYLISIPTLSSVWPGFINWNSNRAATYLLLSPHCNTKSVDAQMLELIRKNTNMWDELGYVFRLKPFNGIYLDQHYGFTGFKNGDKRYVITLAVVGFLILLLAFINFINLYQANRFARIKGTGVQKVFGASSKQIIVQFLMEAGFYILISFILAGVLVVFLLPFINNTFLVQLSLAQLSWQNTLMLLIMVLFAMIITGILPALSFSALKPVQVLKNHVERAKSDRMYLKNTLVSFQFVIAIALVIFTITIGLQRNYLMNKDLGFDASGVVYMPRTEVLNQERYELLKNEWLKHPSIKHVSSTMCLPNTSCDGGSIWKDGMGYTDGPNAERCWVALDFFKTMKIKLLQGRAFSPDFSTDAENACILNEKAVQELALKNPLGKQVYFNNQSRVVVGVIPNVLTKSLHEQVAPQIYLLKNKEWYGNNILYAKIAWDNKEQAIEKIKTIWESHLSEVPFEYAFLSDDYEMMYQSEQQLSTLFKGFSLIAILISTLGILGISSAAIKRRTKEIGIRKVNGAKVSEILTMLNKDFVKWVAIAFALATPIAYYAMQKWLQNFAYKTELNWWIFALAGLLALGIALLTVSWQSWRAASRNPVEALRYE